MTSIRSSLSQLHPNKKNPRIVSDKKLEMLKNSLKEFGDCSGIVFNRTTNQLGGGHQRVTVLPKDAKIIIQNTYNTPTRTGTVAEGFVEIDGERFTYREVEWSKDKEKAANLAANKGAGNWDYSLLSEVIYELDEVNFNMEFTLFDEEEIQRVIGGWDQEIESVKKTDENLDGLNAIIKIKCPQELLNEVTIYLKAKLLETSFSGVEVV